MEVIIEVINYDTDEVECIPLSTLNKAEAFLRANGYKRSLMPDTLDIYKYCWQKEMPRFGMKYATVFKLVEEYVYGLVGDLDLDNLEYIAEKTWIS